MADSKVQVNIEVATNSPSAIVSDGPAFERAPNWDGGYMPTKYAVTYTSGGRTAYRNKGVRKAVKAEKRREAEERNKRTPVERRRAFREGRMPLTPEVAKEVLETKVRTKPKRKKVRK